MTKQDTPSSSDSPRWDVIVVTHNSRKDIAKNWADKKFPSWINVITVDNGSSDDSFQLSKHSGFHAIQSTNVGLAKSNNRGARMGTAPYIAFCNPDVTLLAEHLEELEAELAANGGLVAPRLCDDDGTIQPNSRRWPTVTRIVANRLTPKGKVAQKYLWPSGPDWVTGAFIALSRGTFETHAPWSEKYFLYYEDVELCARLKRMKVPVSIAEHVIVPHSWRRESKKLTSRTTRMHLRSAIRFYTQYPKHLFY